MTVIDQTAAPLRGGKTAYGYGDRKVHTHPNRNVVVGSCPTGKLVGDQGEKVKSRASVGCKVPSS